jgi:hypothetical protein
MHTFKITELENQSLIMAHMLDANSIFFLHPPNTIATVLQISPLGTV